MECVHDRTARTADGLTWCGCGAWWDRQGKLIVHVPKSEKKRRKWVQPKDDE